MKFKLQDFFEGAITRMIFKSSDNGSTVNCRYTFLPGEIYEATDDKLIRLIKGEIGDIRQKDFYTAEKKALLESYGIKYEVTRCGSCSGSRPYVLYNPFKILEED